jgi:SAM-dependent methyltransferase
MAPEALDDVMRRALRYDRDAVVREYKKLARLARRSPPVLDLGCGSGTLLETLQVLGVPAEGVDASPTAIHECRRRGLKVSEADLFGFLKHTGTGAWGTLFAGHVIEHLPPEAARDLFAQAWRVLREGGLFILLTPNPRNLYVAGEGFWTDPTHVRPYPATLLKALALSAGFSSLTVRGWWGGLTPKQVVLGVIRWLVTAGLHQPFTGLLAVARK